MWRVGGVLRDYDWGGVDGLAQWCGATGGPQAELWFGAHPTAPSPLVDADGRATGGTLDEVLPQQATPLLVKLLAAARPLSIQVHPDAVRAAALHARGLVPDDAAKTEVLLALEPFSLHAGWRGVDEVARLWRAAGMPEAVIGLLPDRLAAIRAVFALPVSVTAAVVAGLPAAVEAGGVDRVVAEAITGLAADFPGDPGVAVCVLLDHRVLEPGAAIGIRPGVVHSYVCGLGVEVMTSSDNVLRMGLTSKPVALEEALAAVHVDCDPVSFPDRHFPFDVHVLQDGPAVAPSGYRVALCLDGALEVECGVDRLVAGPGQAIVLAEQEGAAQVYCTGRVILAASA